MMILCGKYKERVLLSMKNNPLTNFIGKNKTLSFIGLVAMIICSLYYFTWDCDELFHNAGVLFEMINTISISYIVSLMFYYFQVHLPNYKKEDAQRFFLNYQVNEIVSLMDKPFKKLLNKSDEIQYELANITEEDLNKLDIDWDKPTGIIRNHREISAQEYMEECVFQIDGIIKDILVQYGNIMDSTEYSLLQKIYQSDYHCFIRDHKLNPPGSYTPLKQNTPHCGYGGRVIENIDYECIIKYQELYAKLIKVEQKKQCENAPIV